VTDVDRLFKEYVAEHRSGGEADPIAFLERLEGADRAELAALIDGYLQRSPGRPWDEAAYRGSAAEQLVESLRESLLGASGSWPFLLPELRHRAEVKREDLVSRLAEALGVAGKEEKVGDYYNQMEHGLLEPEGVSDRVLDALANLLNTTRDALRRAGRSIAPGEAGDTVFARTAIGGQVDEGGMASPALPPERPDERERDEVDELFLGG
jgi:hypothetical protein